MPNVARVTNCHNIRVFPIPFGERRPCGTCRNYLSSRVFLFFLRSRKNTRKSHSKLFLMTLRDRLKASLRNKKANHSRSLVIQWLFLLCFSSRRENRKKKSREKHKIIRDIWGMFFSFLLFFFSRSLRAKKIRNRDPISFMVLIEAFNRQQTKCFLI